MAIFLGIDGGGSKTCCLVGDENAVLGSGRSGGSNVIRVGETRARESLTTAIRQACVEAKVSPAQVQRTCMGGAGAARAETEAMLRRILSEIVPGEIQVVGDMVIALEAAFGGGAGVIVIAGTGSIAYGRNAGQTVRAGGWGPAVSDEGSGHWIGRAAVSAALRGHDQGKSAPLLEAIMKSWGVSTQEQLVLTANATPAPDFSALFPMVCSAADAGDALARDTLHRAGAELAVLAGIVIQRLFPGADAVPVAMSGGVFQNSPTVREVFYNSLRSKCAGAVVSSDVVDPVRGALEMARRGAQH